MLGRLVCCVILILGLVLSGTIDSYADFEDQPEIYCKHWVLGYPLGVPESNDLIIRDLYALSSNDDTKFADWVAYKLTPREVWGFCDPDREWRTDPWLDDSETLTEDELKGVQKKQYQKLDFNRGHQAPLASFIGTAFPSETNYTSNITPQCRELNNGPWKKLEDAVRDTVKTGKELVVYTGTLYEHEVPFPLDTSKDYQIPSGYWKIVILPDDNPNNTKVQAFMFENSHSSTGDFEDYACTVGDIEQPSHLTFFWQASPGLRQSLLIREDDMFLVKGN